MVLLLSFSILILFFSQSLSYFFLDKKVTKSQGEKMLPRACRAHTPTGRPRFFTGPTHTLCLTLLLSLRVRALVPMNVSMAACGPPLRPKCTYVE